MRRPVTALALSLLAGIALVGCRTSPNVAAYIGDETISVDRLDRAVDERLAAPAVAEAVGDDPDDRAEFRRQVLTQLVNREVFAAAAERYDVEVSDADVQERISALLGGGDVQEAFDSLAAEGYTREDVVATVNQQLVVERVAVAAGEAEAVDEESLRAQYEALRASDEARPLGVITLPDQAAADAAVARLEADASSYADIAAQNPGQTTLPTIDSLAPAQLTPELAAAVLAAPAGSVFSRPVPEYGGVVVVYVPAFEDVAFALAEQPRSAARQAGTPLVLEVAEDLDISVNPRYGEYDQGEVVPAEGGVVQLLDEAGAVGGGAPALPAVGAED